MAQDLTALPERITAGTTVKYSRTYADFPASAGWAATLYVAGAAVDSFNGVAVGDRFDFTLTAAETAALPPGVYQWQERATKAGETFLADEGTVTVDPNIATAAPGDLVPFAEGLLPQVEAAIEGLVSGKVAEYQVAGRAVRYNDLEFLYKLRNELANAVKAGQHAGQFGPTIQAHFRRPV